MLHYLNIFIYIKTSIFTIIYIQIPIRIIIDWISCLFIRTVSIISGFILIFRIYYIPIKNHNKFILLLLIFVISIIILILRNNIFLILLGWDILGITSYILVIFYQNHSSRSSGSITLLTNRIGDIIFLLSIRTLIYILNWEININEKFNFLILILILIARCTKRAQFPFSAWLPIAISAPTPISALVHSSTLVTAGIYLLIRITENIHPNSILFLIIISSSTAFYAGICANWEQDIKKIIALSTLSQIAIIIFSLSIKSIPLAFFHIIIHAFFKSLIFICAGIIIHESSYQDIRIINNSFYFNPSTNSVLGLSNIALIGFPFSSGFISKDIIIDKIISTKIEYLLTLVIILSIGITSTYSIRILFLTNKNFIKSKVDYINNTNKFCINSILIISPTTIILGTIIIWIINPQQLIIIPLIIKTIIIIILIIGMTIGICLSFKNFSFIKIGLNCISLWFIHFISTKSTTCSSPIIKISLKNDRNWQEIYGPSILHFIIVKSSRLPELFKLTFIILLIIILILLIIIL